jgi:DNA polymerase III subunit gamma/tau
VPWSNLVGAGCAGSDRFPGTKVGAQSLYCEKTVSGRPATADMDHISLYRKWRPQAFDEVVGQPHVTDTISNALSSGRLVHAYLFCGPRGTGKTSTARILAKAINCEQGPTATPCNQCEACISISEGTALDVIEIDAASNRKIDEIRDLLDKIPYTPTSLRSKVYIIDEVHQLTTEASSALLKTLEEPPGHVRFVLATTEPHKILPTIVSRCQRFDFSLVQTDELAGLLGKIAVHEGIEIEPEAIGMIAEHARGSVRDAIGVMDQISNLAGENVTYAQVADMLGEVEAELTLAMVDALAERDAARTLELTGRAVETGKDPRRFVESLITHLRSLFLIQNAASPREIVQVTDGHFERLADQANRFRRHEVIRLIERLGEAHREMRNADSARLVLECALVKATRIDADVSLDGLLFRLEEIERKLDAGAQPSLAIEAPKPRALAPKREASQPKKKEIEAPAPAAETTVEPPAKPAAKRVGGAEAERANRALKAVLAELKSRDDMRIYSLLTKAKVLDATTGDGGEAIALGFGPEASFQLKALSESGDAKKIEEIWSRLVEHPVRLSLEAARGRREPAEKPAATPVETPKAPPAAKSGKSAKIEPVEAADPPASEEEQEAPGEGAKSIDDIARLIEKDFDGEIIEDGGKE